MPGDAETQRLLGELNGTLKGIGEMLNRHETTISRHSDELAESRGASRANRWLAVSIPPALVVIVETAKAVFHIGGGHS